MKKMKKFLTLFLAFFTLNASISSMTSCFFDSLLTSSTESSSSSSSIGSATPIIPNTNKELEFIYDKSNDYYIVTGVLESFDGTEITIPSLHNDKPVLEINRNAFANHEKLTSIKIPNSITNIHDYAFINCKNLTDIEIPDSVVDIGAYAFANCSSLKNITLSNSLKFISSYTFENCIELEDITIPESIITIGHYAFSNCTALTEIKVSNPFASIRSYAFMNCTGLTKADIGSITSLYPDAFSGCTNLIKTVNGVHYVGNWAIGCDNSVTHLVLKEDTKGIANSAFESNTKLTDVTLNNSLISIGSCAFSSCTNLVNLNLGNSVEYIDAYAFCFCESLSNVDIPDSVSFMGTSAFGNCFLAMQEENGVRYLDDWVQSCDKNLTAVTLRENTRGIMPVAFSDAKFAEIDLPESLIYISNSAFQFCRNLTSIEIPDSVQYIEAEAFKGCSSLTSVIIGTGVQTIDEWVFYSCEKLTSVTFKDISFWYETKTLIDWKKKTGGIQINVSSPSANADYLKKSEPIFYLYKL